MMNRENRKFFFSYLFSSLQMKPCPMQIMFFQQKSSWYLSWLEQKRYGYSLVNTMYISCTKIILFVEMIVIIRIHCWKTLGQVLFLFFFFEKQYSSLRHPPVSDNAKQLRINIHVNCTRIEIKMSQLSLSLPLSLSLDRSIDRSKKKMK